MVVVLGLAADGIDAGDLEDVIVRSASCMQDACRNS